MARKRVEVEICVDSYESALAAGAGGADRIELCYDLGNGGTTPSAATIELACQQPTPIHVLIRPRNGHFFYSDSEFEVMHQDVLYAKTRGAVGGVFGVLSRDWSIDVKRTQLLVEMARPMTATFHRAFDFINDPFRAVDQLIDAGVDRILTAGQARTAEEGAALIQKLVDYSKGRIAIMCGGGINAQNAAQLVTVTGATELHAGTSVHVKAREYYSTILPRLVSRNDEYKQTESISRVEADKVRELMESVKGL